MLIPATPDHIRTAAAALRRGQLVALPTETVYGLGADASNAEAVAQIFQLKGRPANHPLIVHVATVAQLRDWACEIPDTAWRLAEKFWPGPLTLILPKSPQVPAAVTGGQDTIALRVPAHPVALQLLKAFGGGVAAPSANRFGHVSPTRAEHVVEEFGDRVAYILDGGPCAVGVESTILDLRSAPPALLRPGRITRAQIEAVLQCQIAVQPQRAVRAPGMLAVHYAPRTPAWLCDGATLLAHHARYREQGKAVGLLTCGASDSQTTDAVVQCLPADPQHYEAALYHALRQLDRHALDVILVERPPQEAAWIAVNDRLSKATIADLDGTVARAF